MQHSTRTVDGGDMRLRQAAVEQTSNTTLLTLKQLYIMRVVQMKPVRGAASEYNQLQVIMWFCA
jgi:hypothetical protein